MNKPPLTLSQKIGFLGKGGAGKSTCLVLVANALQKSGYDVYVLDADSTNFGLHQALGIHQLPTSLLEYYGGMVFQGGKVTCPVDDPSLLDNATLDIDRLPSKYYARNPDGITFLRTGKLAEFGVGAGCDGPIVKLARDIKIQEHGSSSVLLVDFKAGLEDLSRGAMVTMDAIVAVCDPSTAGIQTAISLNSTLEAQRAGNLPATAHLESHEMVELAKRLYREHAVPTMHVVFNKVPDQETRHYLYERLSAENIPVAGCLPDSREIRLAWLHGDPLPISSTSEQIQELVEAICSPASTRSPSSFQHSRNAPIDPET